MKNLQTLANELAANKMTLLVTNDMLNVKGGGKNSKKYKSGKKRSKKSKRGYGGGYGGGHGGGHGNA